MKQTWQNVEAMGLIINRLEESLKTNSNPYTQRVYKSVIKLLNKSRECWLSKHQNARSLRLESRAMKLLEKGIEKSVMLRLENKDADKV